MSQPRKPAVPIALWIAFFAFADLLLAFPEIDLAVSRAFYTPAVGFATQGETWERLAHNSVDVLMVLVNVLLIGIWLINRRTGRSLLRLNGRRLAYLLCVLVLLPGLLVNQVFKEHWGRARPVKVLEFGGTRTFTPAFLPADQGGGSFSSGHAAAAAYLIVVAATLRGPRSGWVLLAVLYTGLIGLVRMASGGHFLSDVLASVFLVLIGALLLHRAFYPTGPGAADPG